jgi:hypothetical protein
MTNSCLLGRMTNFPFYNPVIPSGLNNATGKTNKKSRRDDMIKFVIHPK